MKSNWEKRAAVMAMAAVLSVEMGMVARADGWVEQEGGWRYEQNGGFATDSWKKGVKGYYYLDDAGYLAASSWINADEDRYYVNEEGVRVTNQWVSTRSPDNSDGYTEFWYYFDSRGKMVTGKQQIGDKKYLFSDDGKMLTGWATYVDGMAEPLTEDISHNDTYYCLESGALAADVWQQLVPPTDGDVPLDESWYNFEGNGKIRLNTKTKVGDYDYCFDTQGRMIDGWAYQTSDPDEWVKVDDNTEPETLDEYKQDTSRYLYCGADGNGAVVKNLWHKVVPYDKLGNPDEGDQWYYFDRRGKMTGSGKASPSDASPSNASHEVEVRKVNTPGQYKVKGGDDEHLMLTLKTVKNKLYLFNGDGRIVDGLVYLYNRDNANILNEGYYCFESNTSRTTGKVMKTEDGIEYEYQFATKAGGGFSEGQGITGIYSGKLFYKGLRVTSKEDEKFAVVSIPSLAGKTGTGMFLVDENGKIKTGQTSKDDNGNRYQVKAAKNKASGYIIYRIEEGGSKEGTELAPKDADITLDFAEPEQS